MLTGFRKRFRSLPLFLAALLFFTLIILRVSAFAVEEDDDLQIIGISPDIKAAVLSL